MHADDSAEAGLHLRRAEDHVQKGNLFAAVEEYRLAIASGVNDAGVQQQLSILLYHQGFVDEAIEAMKRAIDIDPDTDYLHHELGLLYFAKGDQDNALNRFAASLKINPGHTDSHFYLAQLFRRQQNMTAARMFARSASALGHPARELGQGLGLEHYPDDRTVWFNDDGKIYLRQILTGNRESAEQILTRIAEGESFEQLARDLSRGANIHRGGYAGGFSPGDLNPEIVSALTFMNPLSPAIILELETGLNVIQKIAPLDWSYIKTVIGSGWGQQKESQAGSRADGQKENVGKKSASVPPGLLEQVGPGHPVELSATVADVESAPLEKQTEVPATVQQQAPAGKGRSEVQAGTMSFWVQAGAFQDKHYALQRIERLKKIGYASYLHIESDRPKGWLFVIAATYGTYGEAYAAVKQLKNQRIDAFVLERP